MINNAVFQYSLSDALLNSLYDGDITIQEILSYGDFGLGTINGLNGELILYNGVAYTANKDGVISKENMDTNCPIVTITNYIPSIFETVKNLSLIESYSLIDRLIPTENIFYAIKIEGFFKNLKLRSGEKQIKPYNSILEVAKKMNFFTFENLYGIILGFRCPPFVKGINVPGYHFHFIDNFFSKGGHVLDFNISKAEISIDIKHNFQIILPKRNDFYKLKLHDDLNELLLKIEK